MSSTKTDPNTQMMPLDEIVELLDTTRQDDTLVRPRVRLDRRIRRELPPTTIDGDHKRADHSRTPAAVWRPIGAARMGSADTVGPAMRG